MKDVIKDTIHKESLLASMDETISHLLDVMNCFSEQSINQIPFEGSWTAAQVAEHLTLSNLSIAKALALRGTSINRNPAERVEELKALFLDFKTKFKSPDFILPTRDQYEKGTVIVLLKYSTEKIKESGMQADLSEMINHPAFGDITKFEILHFVLYHTQRHTHQLENIKTIL